MFSQRTSSIGREQSLPAALTKEEIERTIIDSRLSILSAGNDLSGNYYYFGDGEFSTAAEGDTPLGVHVWKDLARNLKPPAAKAQEHLLARVGPARSTATTSDATEPHDQAGMQAP